MENTGETTVYKTAYDAIKDMILHLEFKPGEHIPETLIASKFNFSRTPIREALRKLESEGLVRRNRNKGAEVVMYTDEQVSQIGTVRLELDILAAKLALHYGSNADFDLLERFARNCEAGASSGDVYARIQTDTDFHMAIANISKNDALIKILSSLYSQIYLIQVSKYTGIESSLGQIHHHMPLVDAFKRRDFPGLVQLMCEHLGEFYCIEPFIIKQLTETATACAV